MGLRLVLCLLIAVLFVVANLLSAGSTIQRTTDLLISPQYYYSDAAAAAAAGAVSTGLPANAPNNDSIARLVTKGPLEWRNKAILDTSTTRRYQQPDLLKSVNGSAPQTSVPAAQHSSNDLPQQWARAFPIWNRSAIPYHWCHKEYIRQTKSVSGILFVKVNKCASSTGMGVTLRIADMLGHRVINTLKNEPGCFARYRHGFAGTDDRQYGSRDAKTSVLWTMVRHPAPRVLSAYFFYQVSRRNHNATEASLLKYVQDKQFQTHYVNYLRLQNFKTREQEIAHLMGNYDFIAVSERMDESLVVLSMLLKIPVADVVVLPSKLSGGYDDGRSKKGCVKLQKKWSTPKIDKYLYGDFLENNWDYRLYQAVNISLDRTIDALGRDKVEKGVANYRQLLEQNEIECRTKAVFPCPIPEGLKKAYFHTFLSEQSCYYEDAGCGYKCTDKVLQNASNEEWKRLQKQQL